MGALADTGRRLVEAAEYLTGREVAPTGTQDLVESYQSDNRLLRKTLDYVGFKLFNFQGGQPHEQRYQARQLTIQKSLTAYAEDPMAADYVDLYVSFVAGRGVPRPQAYDEEVQKRLDEAWDDEANKRVLTSFPKLVEKMIDYNIQSNVLFTLHDDGDDGRVRLSLIRFPDVEGVRRHPRDRYRILYYKVIEWPVGAYDWVRGIETPAPATAGGGAASPAKVTYYEALGAFDEENPVMLKQDEGLEEGQLHPPENLQRPGKIIHVASNKTSEDAFGIPGMRRLMRWWTVNNEVIESHVDRMKAMASVYMKATVKGTERDVERLGQMVTGRSSAFGTAAPAPDERGEHQQAPRGPGVLGQNEGLNYEPFKIDSGAADVAQSLPQLRAQFSGPWPVTYYGQEAQALAGAQSMELPTLKYVEREQELWAMPFNALGDRTIERAVETGDISEYRDPNDDEMARIQAAQAQGDNEVEGLELNDDMTQVKRDLGYEFAFPSPLKRTMGDLVSAAIQVATAVDPNATNPELSRWLFAYCLAEAFDVADPMRVVDQVLPRDKARDAEAARAQIDAATQEQLQGSVGPDGQIHPPDNQYGAPTKAPQPEQRPVTEAPHDGRRRRRRNSRTTQAHTSSAKDDFSQIVGNAAREHLDRLGSVTSNGDGPGH